MGPRPSGRVRSPPEDGPSISCGARRYGDRPPQEPSRREERPARTLGSRDRAVRGLTSPHRTRQPGLLRSLRRGRPPKRQESLMQARSSASGAPLAVALLKSRSSGSTLVLDPSPAGFRIITLSQAAFSTCRDSRIRPRTRSLSQSIEQHTNVLRCISLLPAPIKVNPAPTP